jgi:hypothetical protein
MAQSGARRCRCCDLERGVPAHSAIYGCVPGVRIKLSTQPWPRAMMQLGQVHEAVCRPDEPVSRLLHGGKVVQVVLHWTY